MSQRLASVFLAYGALAGLIAPAGLLAQDEAPPPPQVAPTTTTTTTTTAPAPLPPAPSAPAPQQAAATPAPAPRPPEPKLAADPAPVAVASGPGSVTIKDFSFGPPSVTVNVGDTVTWTNAGPSDHTATASDGSFDTGTLSKGRSASRTFGKAGTFAYVCSIHPNMHGTVKVLTTTSGGGGNGSPSSSGSTTSPSSSNTRVAPGRSSGSLPSTGVDAGGLAIVGAGFLALGLFARRRTFS